MAPLRALRHLRWRALGWSKTTDQQYHDQFYQGPDYDPFSLDYPGYVTVVDNHLMFVLAKNKGGAWGLLQGESERTERILGRA